MFCRCISIGLQLNVGSSCAGMISLCSTTFTSSRLSHSGTWLSPDTTRCTLRMKGIFFSMPRKRYFSVPQSLNRFSKIGVLVNFSYSFCHTGSRPLTYVITISITCCFSLAYHFFYASSVLLPYFLACDAGLCFHRRCDHIHSSGDLRIIASKATA